MLCRVCDQEGATKWNFYGVDSICHSCRGFFMRSVQTSDFKTFHKKQCNSKCVIESKSRKSCKKCRFEKCLSVGMKINFVKSQEQKRLQKNIAKPIELKFGAENQMRIRKHWEKIWLSSICDYSFKMYASNEKHLLRTFAGSEWRGQEIQEFEDFDNYLSVQGMKLYALAYFKLEKQCSHDAFKLLKHNFDRMWTFLMALSYCNNEVMIDCTRTFLEYGEKHRNQCKDIDFVMTKLSEIKDDPFETCKPTNDDVFYGVYYKSPWASHIEIEIEHETLFKSISQWYLKSKDGSPGKVDEILLVLVMQILLLNTDFITEELKNKMYVQTMQQKCASMLHLYLKSLHPNNYSSLLSRGLMLVHDTQRAHELSLQRLKLF